MEPNSPLFDQSTPSAASTVSQPLALPEESPNPSPGFFSTLVRLLLALAITIGLIFVTVWGLKIIWEKRGWNNVVDEGKPVRILTSTYLAPRKTIHLVEVANRILVLGVGNEEVNCLEVIREPAEVESLREATQPGFHKIFTRITQKHETAQKEVETQKIIEESSRLVGGYLEKLKKITKDKKTPPQPKDGKE